MILQAKTYTFNSTLMQTYYDCIWMSCVETTFEIARAATYAHAAASLHRNVITPDGYYPCLLWEMLGYSDFGRYVFTDIRQGRACRKSIRNSLTSPTDVFVNNGAVVVSAYAPQWHNKPTTNAMLQLWREARPEGIAVHKDVKALLVDGPHLTSISSDIVVDAPYITVVSSGIDGQVYIHDYDDAILMPPSLTDLPKAFGYASREDFDLTEFYRVGEGDTLQMRDPKGLLNVQLDPTKRRHLAALATTIAAFNTRDELLHEDIAEAADFLEACYAWRERLMAGVASHPAAHEAYTKNSEWTLRGAPC